MPQDPGTIVLISSTKDTASTTIAKQLTRRHGFESTGVMFMGSPVFQMGSVLLAFVGTEIVTPPDLDAYFNPRAYVFLSRHRAESGIPSLTVHTTGNFTDAPLLGAGPKEVGHINPDLQKNYLIALSQRKKEVDGYEVTIEATHHGPTSLSKPVLFVELGSSERNWGDEHAASVIGDALMDALTRGGSWGRVALGFGGTHYPEKFNRLLLEGDMALSAVVSKRSLDGVDGNTFGQIIQKTTKSPRFVAMDWKGMGRHKEKIMGLARQFALDVVRL